MFHTVVVCFVSCPALCEGRAPFLCVSKCLGIFSFFLVSDPECLSFFVLDELNQKLKNEKQKLKNLKSKKAKIVQKSENISKLKKVFLLKKN